MNKPLGRHRASALSIAIFFAALAPQAFPAPKAASLEPAWARSVVSSAGWSVFAGGAVDKSGKLYAAGWIGGGGDFDFGNGIRLTGSPYYEQALLVKYDAAGKALWARCVKDVESRYTSVAVSASGKICAAGSAAGSALVVQYGADGNELWENSGDAEARSSAFNAVTIDEKGFVYAAGYAEWALMLRSGYIEDSDPARYNVEKEFRFTEGLLAKYDEHGSPQWVSGTFEHKDQLEEADEEDLEPIVFYAVAAVASIEDVAYVGGTIANSFAVRYFQKGRCQQGIGCFEQEEALAGRRVASRCASLAIVGPDPVLLFAAGSFEGAARHAFEERGPAVKGTAAVNPLIAECDMVWPEWAQTMASGSGKSEYKSLVFAGLGLVAAGYITGVEPFAFGVDLRAIGFSPAKNAVIVQYSRDGAAQAARSVASGRIESEFNGLAMESWGADTLHVYALGAMTGKGPLAFGPGASVEGKSPKSSALIVKYALKDLTIY
jgi:hypothetical protein